MNYVMEAKRPKKKKAGFTRDDWPETAGRVNDHGYCVDCKTYWCPHAKPGMYTR